MLLNLILNIKPNLRLLMSNISNIHPYRPIKARTAQAPRYETKAGGLYCPVRLPSRTEDQPVSPASCRTSSSSPSSWFLHDHQLRLVHFRDMYIYIYIYIYVCVCVCVCVSMFRVICIKRSTSFCSVNLDTSQSVTEWH